MGLNNEEIVRTLFSARARLLAATWLITRDIEAAEDIFQETSLKAMGAKTPFEHEGHLLSWSMVTCRHQAIDWLRHRRPSTIPLDADVLDMLSAASIEEPASAHAGRLSALQACLDAMPLSGRRLVDLRYGAGRSCEQVAAEIGIGLDAVYKRLSRLHEALRECVNRRVSSDPGMARES